MKTTEQISMAQKVVKLSANLIVRVAKSDVNATSWGMICQPKEPSGLAQRVESMSKRD